MFPLSEKSTPRLSTAHIMVKEGERTHRLFNLLPLLLRQLILLLLLPPFLLQAFPLALQAGVLALLLCGGCAEGRGHGAVGEFAEVAGVASGWEGWVG